MRRIASSKLAPLDETDLKRGIIIDICKDGTFTVRNLAKKKPFNGHALPVFSVHSRKQAEDIRTRFCHLQYGRHPQLKGEDWYRITEVDTRSIPHSGWTLDDLKLIAQEFRRYFYDYLESQS